MLNFLIRKDVRKILKRKDSDAGERGRALEELRASMFSKLRLIDGAKRQQQSLWGPTVALTFNFLVSVSIILMNKLVLVRVGFNYPIFLTFIHYVVSWLIMALLKTLSILSLSSPPKSTKYSSLLSLGIVMSLSTGLANVSLKYNSVGFYQMAKIAVTPAIVLAEFILFRKRISVQKVLALTVVSIGVAVATVTDLQFHFFGACIAVAWIIPSAVNKILWSNLQQQDNWSALALMWKTTPITLFFLVMMMPSLDPPGVLSFDWNFYNSATIGGSAVLGFLLQWSGALALGATSATTHVVLGQFKTCVILLGGFFLFGSNPGLTSILGAATALIGMSLYTYLNLQSRQQSAKVSPRQSALPLLSKSKLSKENGPTPLNASSLYISVFIRIFRPTMLMALISSHLSIFTFLLFLSSTALPFSHSAAQYYLKLPLLHKDPYPPTPSEALSADNHRLSTLFSALRNHPHPKLPVNSAASSGSGQYLVSLHLGTPPQRLLLVADTGSDLTWVSCSACRSHCSPRATFFPRHSATFSPYHCFDSACTLVPHPKKTPHCNRTRLHTPCRYEYSYSDGSITNGFFSRETTTFNSSAGKLLKFQRLSFGCGFWNSGPTVSGPSFNGANGVLGLGRGPISFSSQLGRVFGHKFSYCLMDYSLSPPPTSYLLIGGGSGNGVVRKAKLSYTPLLINPLSPTFYYIGIESVLIEDIKLRISPSVWAIDELGNGGTVLDSGTTLTFLAEPAYRRILAVFEQLVKLPKSSDPNLGFDLCLNVSGLSTTSLPQLSFKLSGGALFSPPPQNYFIDTAEGVKCLALQPVVSESGFSVIGNLMQQGYTLEFDKDRSRLGFTRHGCAVP